MAGGTRRTTRYAALYRAIVLSVADSDEGGTNEAAVVAIAVVQAAQAYVRMIRGKSRISKGIRLFLFMSGAFCNNYLII